MKARIALEEEPGAALVSPFDGFLCFPVTLQISYHGAVKDAISIIFIGGTQNTTIWALDSFSFLFFPSFLLLLLFLFLPHLHTFLSFLLLSIFLLLLLDVLNKVSLYYPLVV